MAKTNSGLVEYCKAKVGCYYWYGTFGQMASKSLYNQKSSQYPTYYTAKDFAKQIANPKQVFDCAGLIKAYLWTDSIDDTTPTYNAKQDFGATAFYNHCTKKGTIDSFDKVVGRLLFKGKGSKMSHVGVYIGDGKIAEAKGHAYGVVISDLDSKWTHWGQCNLITEDSVTPEPAPQPTPAPTPKPESNKYIVDPAKVHTVLNVRTGPGTGYKVVGHLQPKTEVTVIKTNGSWAAIGIDRWVSSNYLKKI